MASEKRTIQAKCLCGNANHEITLPASDFPLKAYLCHCDSCRHMTGTLCLTVAFLDSKSYQPSDELVSKLTGFQFSDRITQYHCSTCGCFTIARCQEPGSDAVSWDIATGTLEQVDGVFDFIGHEHIQDTLDGGFSDFLVSLHGKDIERWPGHIAKGTQLPLYWQSETTAASQVPRSERLRARCKCNGVEMWVARPSARSTHAKSPLPDVLHPAGSSTPPREPEDKTWWLRDKQTKFLGGVCSCDSCRLASGMEVVEWAFIPVSDITLDEEGREPLRYDAGTLKAHQSSPDVTRYFCGRCGALVFFTCDQRPSLLDLAVGLLEAPEGARAESWLEWGTKRLSFREDSIGRAKAFTEGVEDGLARYGKRREGKE